MDGHVSDLRKKLDLARDNAILGGLPARRKDSALYGILAECLGICNLVDASGARDELVKAITERDKQGRNRIYVYPQSDTHILVCRYVLEGHDNRNSIYRYAAALREATALAISSDDLVKKLTEEGGINTLFKSRPLKKRTFETSTLHLNSKVNAPKDSEIVLRLKRDERGFFDVLSCNVAGDP
jgi:hypothetical protein